MYRVNIMRMTVKADEAERFEEEAKKQIQIVTEPRGAPVRGESVCIGEVCWIPLLPPDKPGLYAIRFFAALDSGQRLEARGLLTVVADEGHA